MFYQVKAECDSKTGFVVVLHIIHNGYQPDFIITQYCAKINISHKLKIVGLSLLIWRDILNNSFTGG